MKRINPEEEPLDAELDLEPFSLQKRLSLTPWDELVARDISFDPRHHFETVQSIDLGEKNPQWRTITAKEREIDAKQGKVSLREKYKKIGIFQIPRRAYAGVTVMLVMTGCWSVGMVPLESVGWADEQMASTTSMPSVT